MFIIPRLKKAYFRVPKTGSASQSFVLRMADVATEDDIVTGLPIGGFPGYNVPDYEQMRREGKEGLNELVKKMGGMPQHFTPQHAINAGLITQEQLEEYQVFICCRNPLDRYLSAFKHQDRKMPVASNFRDDIENNVDYKLLTRPTVNYAYCGGVMIADLLDFDDYEAETRRMLAAFGGDIFPIIPRMNNGNSGPLFNDTPNAEDYWTPALKEKIRTRFAADVELYESMKAGLL